MKMKDGKPRTSNAAGAGDRMPCKREEQKRSFDLEERLRELASAVIDLSEKLPPSRAGNHVAGQILRSGTSPCSNHGEAESAESREDFNHKLKVCLNELRETRRRARLIERKRWARNDPPSNFVPRQSDELIRIFMSSIKTAQRKARKRPDAPAPSCHPAIGAGSGFDVQRSMFDVFFHQ